MILYSINLPTQACKNGTLNAKFLVWIKKKKKITKMIENVL